MLNIGILLISGNVHISCALPVLSKSSLLISSNEQKSCALPVMSKLPLLGTTYIYILYLFLEMDGPEGRTGSSDVSPLSGNQGFHLIFCLSVCSLVILPSPVAPSDFSLFLLLAQSPAYFPEISLNFCSFFWYVLPLFLVGFLAAEK